jgi:DNA-binding response OmpR family regulator
MRVLVVDDEVHLAESVGRGLRGAGFDVDLAHDGVDGFWMAQERNYAAIVLDILLPGKNGFAICRDLRAAANWTPILMLTAKRGEYDEAEALDTGADDFLSKPFSFVVLVARVRALTRRGTTPRPPVMSCGDLVLDPVTRTCQRGDELVDLTPRELTLLEALLRSPGAVVPKSDLVSEVWGDDFDGESNVVEVYVRYLRRKIDEPFGRASLRTIRGHGYQLVDDSPRPVGA